MKTGDGRLLRNGLRQPPKGALIRRMIPNWNKKKPNNRKIAEIMASNLAIISSNPKTL